MGDEIVVANDCSTDGTLAIIEDYQRRWPAVVKLVQHQANKGGAAARNSAAGSASNTLLFCLDSDNILAPSSIDPLVNLLEQENADVAAFEKLWCFKDDTKKIEVLWEFQPGILTLADCLASAVVPPSSGNYLYRKSSWLAVGGYPEFSRALDSWSFGFKQVAAGQKFIVLQNSGYFHRFGHASYWVRDSKSKKLELAHIRRRILADVYPMMSPDSIILVENDHALLQCFLGAKHTTLTLKSGALGRGGRIINQRNSFDQVKRRLNKFVAKFFN